MMTKIRRITVTMIQKQFQKLVRSVDYQLTRLYVMHIIPHTTTVFSFLAVLYSCCMCSGYTGSKSRKTGKMCHNDSS